jgi:leucyl aminopeptidase
MSEPIVAASHEATVPIRLVRSAEADAAVSGLSSPLRAQAKLAKFAGKPGEVVVLTDGDGPAEVLAGLGDGTAVMALRALPAKLPAGLYALTLGGGVALSPMPAPWPAT